MRRKAVVVAALAALSLSACGGEGSGSSSLAEKDPVSVLAATAGKTTSAGSSAMHLTSQSTIGGQPVSIDGEGAFDYATGDGELTMKMKVGGQDLTIATRIVDKVMYLQFPGQPGWSSIPLEKALGTSLGSNADPSQALKLLAGASADVTKVGTEDVGGEETTHYKGTIDVSKATATLSGAAKAAAEKSFTTLGVTSLPFDAYIDGEGRLRKMVQTFSFGTGATAGTSTTTVEFSDFGKKVTVEAPPAAEVHDGSSLLGLLGGGT